ncbi:MAG: 6-carboxytetrahydropterin synthase [Alphaproteobacteria bacterium]|nr:6-carboxytetrahydropterin synthase [Alphaproteobacteria bacterium]
MYELSKEFWFDAAHTLNRDVDDQEREGSLRIHGHSYRAEITLRGLPDSNGMLVDVYEFEKSFEDVRHALDHRFLDEVPELGPATMENLCAFIWKQLAPKLPLLYCVTVYRDSGHEKCAYFGPVFA